MALSSKFKAVGFLIVISCVTLILLTRGGHFWQVRTWFDSTAYSWHSLLEINPSKVKAGIVSSVESFIYRKNITREQYDKFGELLPCMRSFNAAKAKFHTYVKTGRPGKRNMVMYHVENIALNDHSLDLTLNNVKVFVASILHHNSSAEHEAFYWFNIAEKSTNPATALIPTHLPNVAIVEWSISFVPMYYFLQTTKLLGKKPISEVDAVFSLSSGVRGPFVQFKDAAWISEFRNVLDSSNVGLVGPMVSCSGVPHVQYYAFAIRPYLVSRLVLEEFNPDDEQYQLHLSDAVRAADHKIASLYYAKKYSSDDQYLNLCKRKDQSTLEQNFVATNSCDIHPKDVLFVRWSGENLGAKGFHCGKGIAMSDRNKRIVQTLTYAVTRTPLSSGQPLPAQLTPKLPEITTGGLYTELYAEYDAEHRRELKAMAALAAKSVVESRAKKANTKTTAGTTVPLKEDSQVCFLVRTAKMHDPVYVSPKTGKIKYVSMDLEVFAKSLIAQVNPNWQAYFIITDPSPFERRLQDILSGFNDSRLVYFDVDMAYRPVFTVVDAGYTTTDYVVDQLLKKKECKWISASNGDNAYGSEVVDRILNAQLLQNSNVQPDMLLLPMDSRNFADQDQILRFGLPWNRKCVGIEATTAFTQLTATGGSLPKVARVDLAAIVLNRRKLMTANVKFGNFSNPERYHCLGCNDGYFTQYLVRHQGWTYARLPVDGLRSLMFHGPSPTHCIAAGNIWFDHPDVGKVGCVSHETVYKILKRDAHREVRLFDAEHFHLSTKICLRLSEKGYLAKSEVFQRRLLEETKSEPALIKFKDFDWVTYLEINTDLYPNTKTRKATYTHYHDFGFHERRKYVHYKPTSESQTVASKKLDTFLTSVAQKPGKRNLVIYHIEDIGANDNSLELTMNNVKVFIAALFHHHAATAAGTADQEAFYWFNVAGLMDNPMYDLIPTHLPNVVTLAWEFSPSPFNALFQTIKKFDSKKLALFDAVFVSSSGVRGPLIGYEYGAWLGEFRKLLDGNKVGVVGPVIRCEPTPHVQSHMFAIRTKLLLRVQARYYETDVFMPIEEFFEHHMSSIVKDAKLKMASLLHYKRQNLVVVETNKCVDPFPQNDDLEASCSTHPSELMFLRWSGDSWGARGFICGKGIAMSEKNIEFVKDFTAAMMATPLSNGTLPSHLKPHLPEAPTGWFIYKDYGNELDAKPKSALVVSGKEPERSKVCFLVSVDRAHDSASRPANELYERTYVQELILTLKVQTNPNWKAFFYATEAGFAPQLSAIVESAKDGRLSALAAKSGNTRTPYLDELLTHKECKWVSSTKGNTAYGSEVVDRVFMSVDSHVDLLLAPMDTYAFAAQDYALRGETAWNTRCVGVESMIALYQLSFVAQPPPRFGRVFSASVFYNSAKLAQETVKPGNLSLPALYQCPDCDEGLYPQYLVRSRGWSYARLGLDGLKTIVFDQSSPTHCIAAGNVWFDHPSAAKVGCLTYQTIRKLQVVDQPKAKSGVYDWKHFAKSQQICLRLSEVGTKSA